MAGRAHVEVSKHELETIVEAYATYGNNWNAVLGEVKKKTADLPLAACQLYQTTKYDKLKRRMSDQMKKVLKVGYVPPDDKMATLIQRISTQNNRYQQKGHPLTKNIKLTAAIKDKRRDVINTDLLPDVELGEEAKEDDNVNVIEKVNLEEDTIAEENANANLDVEVATDALDNAVQNPLPVTAADSAEDEPPKKKKQVTDLAREAYEQYLAGLDRSKELENKMMDCMDKFLNN